MSEKELILDLRDYKKSFVTCGLESGVKRLIVPKGKTKEVHSLGRIQTISEDGDIVLGKNFIETKLGTVEDEERVVSLSKNADVLVSMQAWKIIPLENLVSKSDRIFTYSTIKEIPTMLSVLEKGVAGVVIKPKSISDIKEAASLIKNNNNTLDLVEAEVVRIKVLEVGDRCCVDTCSLMGIGEGMLIGSSASFLFLVNSESVKSPYCATRPFRVNGGPVHSYIMTPNNKTKYLGELSTGDDVLLVKSDGNNRKGIIGRNKIEERPLILVEASVVVKGKEKIGSIVLQNAETIRLVKKNNKTISVTKLKKGDKVLVKLDDVARHFGVAIKEKMIKE